MPIERYRSLAEVPPPKRRSGTAGEHLTAMIELLSLRPDELGPIFEPGLRRYASIEAAQADRAAAELARARRLAQRRQREGR